MLALVFTVLAAAPPVSLAFPGLNAVGLEKGEAELHGERLAQKLHALGLNVITARDIGAALGLERQKQLMGCDEGGCVAEIAGALGADGLVVGDIGRLGETYAVNFKIVSKAGATLAIFNAADVAQGELVRTIDDAARTLTKQLAGALNRPELMPATVSTSAPTAVRRLAPWPLVLGGAAVVAGIIAQFIATLELNAIVPAPTDVEASMHASRGRDAERVGWALIATGAVLLVASGVMYLAGGGVSPTVAVVPGGATLGVAGVLP